MKTFAYVRAADPASAVRLADGNSRFIAGGIDLLGEMKEYIQQPDKVVSVRGLPGTGAISENADGFNIGTNVTVAQLAADPQIAAAFPGLAEAAAEVGSPQIRNVATVGGNLAQHSRCWYYRHRDLTCLKRGGSTCYAREGDNRYHSLFSGNPCISPVVSNLAVILTALNATANVQRGDKIEKLTLPALYAKAWENPQAHNSLAPNELILGVDIPKPLPGMKSTYLQMSQKSDFDWAIASCAAAAQVQNGTFSKVKIVMGCVAPVPYEIEAAGAVLEGKTANEADFARAADILLDKATILEHNGYKFPIARTLILRALRKLAA